MNKNSTLNSKIEEYIQSGIGVLIPLKADSKSPILKGVHGKVLEQTPEAARHNFDGLQEKCNAAVRLADTVIVLDVDVSETKHGDQTLAALEAEYCNLPRGPYNTRHGANAAARHMFYRVPAGFEWRSPSSDIDIIHRAIRYAVVAPSVVDGKAYHWYDADGTELDTIPRADELPELPKAWIEFLKKGPATDNYRPGEVFDLEATTQWLEASAPACDSALTDGTRAKLDGFLKAIEDDAHETAIKAVRWIVRYCVLDGAPGLNVALAELEEKFTEVREARPTGEAPAREWGRILADEVNKLRGEVEAGRVTPFIAKHAPVDIEAITGLTGAKKAAVAHGELIDQVREIIRKNPMETAGGELLALAMPGAKAITSPGKDSGIFDETNRVEWDRKENGRLTSVIKNYLNPLLEAAFYPIPVDADDDLIELLEGLNKEIGGIKWAMDTHNKLPAFRAKFAVALEDAGRTVRRKDIDSNPALLGLPDGRVVDLNLATADCELVDVIRPRLVGELVTLSLDIDPKKAIAALAHRRKFYKGDDRKTPAQVFLELAFPNPEVRKVAQKLLGYAAYGYMESQYRNLPVFYGPTSTGKTVLTDLIKAVAGTYYGTVGIEALSKSDDGPNSELAKVIHSRWLVLPELSTAQKAASERLKALTSTEGVKATPKYSNDPVESNTLTPIIVTNDAPEMKIDDAILKRLVVIPMTTPAAVLTEKLPKRDKGNHGRMNVYGELVNEHFTHDDENKAYMLEWLTHGFILMREEGIDQSTMPTEIQEANAQFVGEADPLAAWLAELDYSDKNARVLAKDLKESFEAEYPDVKFPSGAPLKKLMAARGCEYSRPGGKSTYSGVQIPEDLKSASEVFRKEYKAKLKAVE